MKFLLRLLAIYLLTALVMCVWTLLRNELHVTVNGQHYVIYIGERDGHEHHGAAK